LTTRQFIEYVRRFDLAEIISETDEPCDGKRYTISYPLVMGLLTGGTISVTQDTGDSGLQWRTCLMGGKRNSRGHRKSWQKTGAYPDNRKYYHLNDYSYKVENGEDEPWRSHSVIVSYRHYHCVWEDTGRGFYEKALMAPLGDDDSMIYHIVNSEYNKLVMTVRKNVSSVLTYFSPQIIAAFQRKENYLYISSKELSSWNIGIIRYGKYVSFSKLECSIFNEKGIRMEERYYLSNDGHRIYLKY